MKTVWKISVHDDCKSIQKSHLNNNNNKSNNLNFFFIKQLVCGNSITAINSDNFIFPFLRQVVSGFIFFLHLL